MRVTEPIGLSDLAQCRFVPAKEMALDLFLAYDRQISFLSNVAYAYYTYF